MPKPNKDGAALLVRNHAKKVMEWVRIAKQGFKD